jgi:hypothetical protein
LALQWALQLGLSFWASAGFPTPWAALQLEQEPCRRRQCVPEPVPEPVPVPVPMYLEGQVLLRCRRQLRHLSWPLPIRP